jgi:putative phosphoesterase
MLRRIGVISDTHGLLRPAAVQALTGSDLILHAGDVGAEEILEELETIAPLVAVRGNVDRGVWARDLPDSQVVEVDNHLVYILHDLEALDLKPEAAGISVVVFGHSHQPEIQESRGVRYFNPGSAGPRRFSNPVTLGFLDVTRGGLIPRVVHLKV